MVYRQQNLHCIQCTEVMETCGGGDRAHHMCPNCSSQWVSLTALRAMIQAMNYFLDLDNMAVAEPSQRACPACRTQMRACYFGKVQLDMCPQANGVWCDPSELQAVLMDAGMTPKPETTVTLMDYLALGAGVAADVAIGQGVLRTTATQIRPVSGYYTEQAKDWVKNND